jgi:hypothetical protein
VGLGNAAGARPTPWGRPGTPPPPPAPPPEVSAAPGAGPRVAAVVPRGRPLVWETNEGAPIATAVSTHTQENVRENTWP